MTPVTADAVAFWAERRSPDAYERYWSAVAQTHRQALIAALHWMPRFTSVHEVGCAVGTNLRMIGEAFPWARLSGSDVNAGAIEYGRARLPEVDFLVADAMSDSVRWAPRTYDMLLSCYALAYVAPTDLTRILRAAIEAAAVGLIFVEPMTPPGLVPGLGFPEWRHDYAGLVSALCLETGRKAQVTPQGLSQPVDRCNGICTVIFKE